MTVSIDEARFGRDLLLPADDDAPIQVTPTGDLQTISGRKNVYGAVLRRLTTSPGTFLYRPSYGAGLVDIVEQIDTPGNRSQLQSVARRNLLEDPRVVDAAVSIVSGVENDSNRSGALTVSVAVKLRDDTTTNLSVDLAG